MDGRYKHIRNNSCIHFLHVGPLLVLSILFRNTPHVFMKRLCLWSACVYEAHMC